MWSPDDRRFIFITGKGGVGKTTVSAALARALAARGKRVLITMCNAKERISAMYGTDAIGSDIAPIAENVWAVNIDPEHAFQEYGRMVLKVPGLYRVVFQNRYVRSFLPAVPGLQEWSMLGKAWYHTTEREADGANRFNVVLFDAPATGHGLDMLRVPKVILEVVPPGVLRRDAETAWKMFTDPAETAVVVVTMPEELPVTETLELVDTVDRELRMPLGALVVNAVLTPLFSAKEHAELAKIDPNRTWASPSLPLSAPESAVVSAARRSVQEQLQATSIERLASLANVHKITLPYLFDDVATPTSIEKLAALF
jgi:anion-transporting  ArsA/GET3 family ATPase